MDFTLGIYRSLLSELQSRGYKYLSFNEYLNSCNRGLDSNIIILRHDVDLLPQNALTMALLEYDLGIRGTYYFRIIPDSFNVGVIELIAELGHEIGYHYEDLDLVRGDRSKVIGDRLQVEVGGKKSEVRGRRSEVRNQRSEIRDQRSEIGSQESGIRSQRSEVRSQELKRVKDNGEETKPETRNKEPETSIQEPASSTQHPRLRQNAGFGGQAAPDLIDRAMESFLTNLEKMRKIVEVKTICMHGSPLSPFDNRMLWSKYDYRDYGIIGEPYFDVDFSEVAYYTDTGRRWDGEAVSVRDKVYNAKDLETGVRRKESEVSSDYAYRNSGVTSATSNEKLATSNQFPRFRSTPEMIAAIKNGSFPAQAMITVHPQRWHDRAMLWVKELVWQNVKNVGKRLLIRSGRS